MNVVITPGRITRPTTLKVPDDAGFGIATAVARAYDLNFCDFRNRDRRAFVSWPRQLAMALTWELGGIGRRKVAQMFRRDPAAVLHARKHVHNLMDVEPKTRLEVESIKARLRL